MKKALINFTLIVGIISFIGACNSDDDSSTATTTSCLGDSTLRSVEASVCSGTASGSITGIDNTTLSGIFSGAHGFSHIAGITGVDNSTDCVDNATLITGLFSSMGGTPTGTNSAISNWAVTSSSNIAQRFAFYSDSSCSEEILAFHWGYKDFAVGDNVSGLTTSVGSNTYSSTATKVSYQQNCLGAKASTDAGITWLKNHFSSNALNPTAGTQYYCGVDGSTQNAFMHVDNSSTYSTTYGGGRVVYWDDEATSDWTTNTDTYLVVE